MFKKIVIKIIKLYQTASASLFKPHCRFQPTCSEYGLLAIEKYGLAKGSLKTIWRLLRCQPFNKGGVDLP